MATKTKREKKPRQQHLPKMGPDRGNPVIDRLAARYVEANDDWKRAGQERESAKLLLETKMKELGIRYYETDEETLSFEDKERLVVKKKTANEEE